MFPGLGLEEFIDAAYQYGAGIDMCWDRLWDYRSIHAQAVICWGRQALYHNFGKERFHDTTLDQADSQLLIALWVMPNCHSSSSLNFAFFAKCMTVE